MKRKFVMGDGTVPCLTCDAALCDSESNYCSWCGSPLHAGVKETRTSLLSILVSVALAQNDAEERGTIIQ